MADTATWLHGYTALPGRVLLVIHTEGRGAGCEENICQNVSQVAGVTEPYTERCKLLDKARTGGIKLPGKLGGRSKVWLPATPAGPAADLGGENRLRFWSRSSFTESGSSVHIGLGAVSADEWH